MGISIIYVFRQALCRIVCCYSFAFRIICKFPILLRIAKRESKITFTPDDAAVRLKQIQLKSFISILEAFRGQSSTRTANKKIIIQTLQDYFGLPDEIVQLELERVQSDPFLSGLADAQEKFEFTIFFLFFHIFLLLFRDGIHLERPLLQVIHAPNSSLDFTFQFGAFFFSVTSLTYDLSGHYRVELQFQFRLAC